MAAVLIVEDEIAIADLIELQEESIKTVFKHGYRLEAPR
jgi:DNA-binding response OmpR family regulator